VSEEGYLARRGCGLVKGFEIKAARIETVECNPGLQDSFRLELNTEIPVFKRRQKCVVKYLGQTISTQLQRRTRYEGK